MRLSRVCPIRLLPLLSPPLSATACIGQAAPRLPGELAWTIGYDPKTFDPAKVDDQESELVRYLTAGVLLRFNRSTQKVEPQLAESWSLSPDGRTVVFKLRAGLAVFRWQQADGKDAAWSIRRVLLPATGAPVAEEFLSASRGHRGDAG
jgi:peptide/nickel transport system substrate-binding protein